MDLFTDDDELESLSSLTSLSSSSYSSDSPPPAEPSPKKRQRRPKVYVSVPPLRYRVVAAASSASDSARQNASPPSPLLQPSQLTTTTTDKPRVPTINSESEPPTKTPPHAPSTTDILKHLHFTKTNSKPNRSPPPSVLPGHPSSRHQHQHEEHDSDTSAQHLAHLINLATGASVRSSSAPLSPSHSESPSVPQFDTVPADLVAEIIRQTVKVTLKEFARCLVICPSCQQQFTPLNASETNHRLQTNQWQKPEPDGKSYNAPHLTTNAENGHRHHALNNIGPEKRYAKPDRRPQQQRYYAQGSCPPEHPSSPRHHDGWSRSRRREDTTAEHRHPVSSTDAPYQNQGKRNWSAFCQDRAGAREEPIPGRRQRQDKPEDVTDLSDLRAADRSAGRGYVLETFLVDQVMDRVLAGSSECVNASYGYARRRDERPHYHSRNHHRPPHRPHRTPNHRAESDHHHHHHYHRDSPRPRSPSPAHSVTIPDHNSKSEEGGRLMYASPSPGWRTGYTYMTLSPARSRSSPPPPPPQPRISPPPLPRYPPLTTPPAPVPPTISKTTPADPYSSGGKAGTREEEGTRDGRTGVRVSPVVAAKR